MPSRLFLSSLVLVGALALGACGEGQKSAREPVKLDQRLSEIYARTCMGCHTVPDSGAPQAHNEAMWAPRMKQGEDVLFTHIVDGFGGMPPLGQCVECTEDDLKTLAYFMAAPAPTEKQQ